MMTKRAWENSSDEFKSFAVLGMKQQIALLDSDSLAAAVARNPSALIYATANPKEKPNASCGRFHSAWMLMLDNLEEAWIARMASSLKMQGSEGWAELSATLSSRSTLLKAWESPSSWNAFLGGIEANPSAPEGFSIEILDLSMRDVSMNCYTKVSGRLLGIGGDPGMAKRWRLAWSQAFDAKASPRERDILCEMWAAAMCEKMTQKEWAGAGELMAVSWRDQDQSHAALEVAVASFIDALAGSGRGPQINLAAVNMIATAASTAPEFIARSIMASPLLDGRALAIIEKKVLGAQSKGSSCVALPRRRGMSL